MALESPSPEQAPDTEANYRVPRRFGAYTLLQRLGRGGMGDVWLAKQKSIADIEKLCVVKTIRRAHTANGEYVRRFIDEARTVVALTHPNVCQVFDVGAIDGTYYLAMEIVFGRNLREVQSRAAERRVAMPAAIVVQIVSEILEALEYAHRLTHQKTGAPLGIVHRDVSPQNAIVSFDGDVKLIDFGLATSTLKVERTEPGVVLGKLQYMSPEHARGEDVDRRADIFAVGVILYELLAGERYYDGLAHDEVWRIAGRGHRPRKIEVLSPSMKAIIERATAPHLPERFATAGELLDALQRVASTERLISSSADVRQFMSALFPGEDAADRKERARLASQPLVDDHKPISAIRFAASNVFPGTERVQQLADGFNGIPSTLPEERLNQLEDSTATVSESGGPSVVDTTLPAARPAFKLSDLRTHAEDSATMVLDRKAPPEKASSSAWRIPVVVGVGLIVAGAILALLLRVWAAQ